MSTTSCVNNVDDIGRGNGGGCCDQLGILLSEDYSLDTTSLHRVQMSVGRSDRFLEKPGRFPTKGHQAVRHLDDVEAQVQAKSSM